MHRQSKIILTTTSVILACGVWAGLAEQHRRTVREFDELQKHQMDGWLQDPANADTLRRADELPDTAYEKARKDYLHPEREPSAEEKNPYTRLFSSDEYRRQAREEEARALAAHAESNCTFEKRKNGTYHSLDAPRLDCLAEAEEMGSAEFVRRYGGRIETDSTPPPALPGPVPSERPKPLRQPGLSGPIV